MAGSRNRQSSTPPAYANAVGASPVACLDHQERLVSVVADVRGADPAEPFSDDIR